MKTIVLTVCCALGGGMIGFFANRLNTVVGSVLFAVGVILLVGAIAMITKKDNENT